MLGAVAQPPDLCGTRGAIVQLHSLAQSLDCSSLSNVDAFTWYVFGTLWSGLVTRSAKAVSLVSSSSPLVSRSSRPTGESHVPASARQIVNGRPPFGIAPRRQITLRLVQQDVRRLRRLERFAVEGDAILFEIHPVIGILHYLSVDAHAARADPTARVGARSQSGLGEDALESLSGVALGFHPNGTVGPSAPQF